MRVVVAVNCDLNFYPSQYYLACAIARHGVEVTVLSRFEPRIPVSEVDGEVRPAWLPIEQLSGLAAKTPILRADYHGVLRQLTNLRPDWVIAQHGLMMSALLYKATAPQEYPVRVAGYFADYIEKAWWLPVMKRTAAHLDAYIDVCDMRLGWREEDWPRLQAPRFVIRNAPPRTRTGSVPPHHGKPRLVFTGRDYGLATRSDLLVRFLRRICEHGIHAVWFLPGTAEERQRISDSVDHSGFSVKAAVGKEELATELAACDVGLLWTPTTEIQNREIRTSYISAAPNKLAEYMAAGLALIHTGNPGLRFIPQACALAIDPWRPEESADTIATFLADRQQLEQMRYAAFDFHLSTLNAEEQTAAFVGFLLGNESTLHGRESLSNSGSLAKCQGTVRSAVERR